MRYLFYLAIALFLTGSSGIFGQNKPENLFIGIPKISTNTNAIVRYSNTTYELKSLKQLVVHYDYAITIVDNGGRGYSTVVIPYDDLSKVNQISVFIYDQLGQKIENVNLNDFTDIPFSAGNLFDDLRLKYFETLQRKLPYTIYVTYKTTYTDFFQLPSWRPQIASDVLVEEAQLRIINSKNFPYRFFISNFSDSSLVFKKEQHINQWNVKKIEAFTEEKYGPSSRNQLPNISFPMDQFQMEGYEGSFKSWQDMSNFDLKLKEGLLELEPETIAYLQSMTDSIDDMREKAKVLYKWMQKETRYVSIQLGIGGWRPFSAKYVDEHKYGDCKALTNYTQAIFNAIGIKSYYTSIQAGKNDYPINPDKVYNQFNHVILCVPFGADTTWLECTSNHSPFGYIGGFTDDRYALVANRNKPKLVKTPKYTFEDNLLKRKSIIEVNKEGGVVGSFQAEYHNIQSEKRWFQIDENLREQMDNLYKLVNVKGFSIQNLEYEFIDDAHPIVYEHIDFKARQVARMASTKMLLPLFYLNKKGRKLKSDENRRFEIVLKRGSTNIDTVVYKIPAQFSINSLPDSISINSDFGHYQSNTWIDGDQIIYTRKEIVYDGRFPPERWEDFRTYKNAVRKADKATAVLQKINQ
jgi:transglutaminase-like putative cysteine protease